MPGYTHLCIPGPTNVPERVRMAMNVAMQDMRAPDFPELTKPIFEKVQKVFRNTSGRVFLYPSSGTGAWEAAIQNTLSPGDKVLMSRFGQFSNLWADMAIRMGLDVDVIDCEWGEGVPVEKYAERLKADKTHDYKAVFATHNETATGVTSDIAGVRRALDDANHPALLMVDGVSSVGSIEFDQDAWGVDCAVSGSQKGFMLPAGLGILSVSKWALEAHKTAEFGRCFFSFEDQMKHNDNGYFPYTPATQILRGLDVSCDMLLDEGLENVWARHRHLASGVRAAVDAWGLKLCAKRPELWSDTVSAIVVPEDKDARDVISTAYSRYNTSLGTGLDKVMGKVFRIGHLGWLNEGMVMTALGVAEMAMIDAGFDVKPGSGTGAAVAHFTGAAARAQTMAAE
ncbi:aminotransferase class V-fold PLP-dependent enzyme [Roseivivax marinus]|jgi:alanine-glyoxylate transaminase/serine-glyoxylate transaminase/serine-pyruvate transaminase|uniref:pyridoxal-phosphate-dependent aminotransferase family protein n=1 Tax=Roseivivax marinus TaxID=1379903 RepID=UPI0008D12DF5|nr:aminotransferase class V-fold PLP-dependent enzyme [Roseivivax marinus]UMA64946.1 aminotransferase class V-fold PLP-dependent enzyme [Roseivivax marinus]SEL90765.1 serine-glyoxylate aminotransferase apoenzyme [Roseivivax marinus]